MTLCAAEHHDPVPKPGPDSWGLVVRIRPVSEGQGLFFSFCTNSLVQPQGSKQRIAMKGFVKIYCKMQVNNSIYSYSPYLGPTYIQKAWPLENSQGIGSKWATLLSPWNESLQMHHIYKNSVLHNIDPLHFAYISNTFCYSDFLLCDCQGEGAEVKKGIGEINGDGRRLDLGWTWITGYRWCVVELCAQNLFNFVTQCHLNKFNKKEKI